MGHFLYIIEKTLKHETFQSCGKEQKEKKFTFILKLQIESWNNFLDKRALHFHKILGFRGKLVHCIKNIETV